MLHRLDNSRDKVVLSLPRLLVPKVPSEDVRRQGSADVMPRAPTYRPSALLQPLN
jgi:hypothetical protein